MGSFGRLRGELSGSRGKIALRRQSTPWDRSAGGDSPRGPRRPRSEWVPRSPPSGTAETRQYGLSCLQRKADPPVGCARAAGRLRKLAARMASAPATAQEPDDPEVAGVAWDLEPLVARRGRGGRPRAAGARRRARAEAFAAAPRRARSPSSTPPACAPRWRSSPRCTSSSAAPAPTPRCASPSTRPTRRTARCSSTCRSAATAIQTHAAVLRARVGRARRRARRGAAGRPAGSRSARHHLRSERRYRPYLLSEPEERILNEKAHQRRSAWARLFAELMSALEVDAAGRGGAGRRSSRRSRGCPAPTASERRARRRGASPPRSRPGLRTRASIFNTLLHDKAVDDRLRGYPHWLASRNLANEASDESVEALVSAVRARYDVPQRWYRLKARLLGVERLADYDRAATVAHDGRALRLGRGARRSCSTPTAASRPSSARSRGASSTSAGSTRRCGPASAAARSAPTRSRPRTRTCCSTTPSRRRDVLTLAHELGHGVHAALAAPQGVFHQSHAADARRDGLGVRRGARVRAPARRRRDAGVAPRAARRGDRGRDRDRLPPDRDAPLRAARAHGAARGGRAVGRALRRRCGARRRRSCSATRSR